VPGPYPQTQNLGLSQPPLGDSPWGTEINANWTAIDQFAGSVQSAVLGNVDAEALHLVLDPATTAYGEHLGNGFTVTVLPAGVVSRVFAKWRPAPRADLTKALKIRLCLGQSGSDVNNVIMNVRIAAVQAGQAVDAPGTIVKGLTIAPPGLKRWTEDLQAVYSAGELPSTAIALGIQIERAADANTNLLYLHEALVEWTNLDGS